ncbi:hypothetical protein F4861DRAFT_521859 [Xylaria intraflava]|nr:hypothetical protein F4861DRAFT_521859 [Xylaria intraflava]
MNSCSGVRGWDFALEYWWFFFFIEVSLGLDVSAWDGTGMDFMCGFFVDLCLGPLGRVGTFYDLFGILLWFLPFM